MPIPPLAPIFKFADGPGLDAFGRLRTSSQITIFDSQQVFAPHTLVWDHHTSGTGTVSHQDDRSSSYLSTGGTASGARALRQSKVYHRYVPGTSLIVKITGVLVSSGTHSGASRSYMMYGDDENGIGLMYDATGFALVKRSKVSGSVVDTVVRPADWNIDKMNNVPQQSMSMITLDPTKSQIFVIDLQWLGVGRVRCGFQINGQFYPVHEFLHANITAGVYMQSASLPVRWEVVNAGGTGANVTLESVCCAVETEGTVNEESGYPWCASNGISAITVPNNAYVPILSIRLKDTFPNSTKKARSHIHLGVIESLVESQKIHYKILVNPTLTGATWANDIHATHSGVGYDTAATALSGGIERGCGYWNTGLGLNSVVNASSAKAKLLLGKTYSGTSDILTIAGRSLGASAATASIALSFIEQY